MKSYRFLGDEAEILGRRLDHARNAYKKSKNRSWAKKYWRQVVERLVYQWRMLPALHDGDAKTTIIPRWTVTYDFFEAGHQNEGYGVTDRVYDRLFRHDANLDASWHRHREARLARAQF